MPSKLQHELNKVRGIVTKTGKISSDSIALLRDALTNAEIAIKALESININYNSKINNALSKATQAFSIANAAIPYTDRSHTLNSIIATNTAGLRIYSPDLSISSYISSNLGYSLFLHIKSNSIDELTGGSGVTIESVLIDSGNVDGRDIATDGTKLDTIATNATKYPDTGEQAFLDADHTKLGTIDSNADVTGSNTPQAHGAGSHTDRNRKFIITPHHTNGAMNYHGMVLDGAGGAESGYFIFKLPEDYTSIVGIDILHERTAPIGGNIYLDITLHAAASGEPYNTHTNNDLNNIIAITDGNINTTILDHTTLFNNVTKNDYIFITVYRDSADGNDTYGADISIPAIEIEYLADM